MTEKLKNTKYISGPSTYVASTDDDYIQVNTSLGPVVIYIPNIINSGLDYNRKNFYINDFGGAASVNNITITSSGGNLINGVSSIILSTNKISAEVLIVNNNEWQANLSTDVGGSTPVSGPLYLRGNAVTPYSVRISIVGTDVVIQELLSGVWTNLVSLASPV